MLIAMAILMALLMGVGQYLVLTKMVPRCPVGDEAEYLRPGEVRPLFVRVPLMRLLATASYRFGNGESTLRGLMTLAGIFTVFVIAAAAWYLAGFAGVLCGLALLMCLPERVILNTHIWPDPLLGLWMSLIALLIIAPVSETTQATGLGVLIAVSVMTRIDQLMLLVTVPVAVAMTRGISIFHLALVALPSLIGLLIATFKNYLRYGVALPDNTWVFNIRVAAIEVQNGRQVNTQRLISQAIPEWQRAPSPAWRHSLLLAMRQLGQSPLQFVAGVLKRAWSLLAVDSFVSQRLLPPAGNAYPMIGKTTAFWLHRSLRISFPLVVGCLVFLCFSTVQQVPAFMFPTLGAYAAASALHTRTRFRMACIPGLVMWGAASLPLVADRPIEQTMMAGCLAMMLCVLLVVVPGRTEE